MKAAVLYGVNDLRYKEFNDPVIKPEDVLLKVNACGVCGSDIPRYFKTGSYNMPKILGHEFAGQVVKCGKRVHKFSPGDFAAVVPLIPCRKCHSCRNAMYFHCENYNFLGSRSHGGMAEFCAVPQANLVRISPKITKMEAAMFEPIAVAMHAVNRTGINKGDKVVVFGAGAIGIFAAQCSKLRGAGKVWIVDIREKALVIAAKCGITDGIDGKKVDVVKFIKEATGGFGADAVIEAAGAEISSIQALAAVRKKGNVGLVGRVPGDLRIPAKELESILRREIDVLGIWGFEFPEGVKNDWVNIAKALQGKKIVVEPLITHKYNLSQTKEAIEMMGRGKEYYCKVMLEIN